MDLEHPSKAAQAGLCVGDSVGPWKVEGELGRGGMSTVYAVIHAEIGKRAALKVVHGHVLSSAFPPARVILEAQVVNRIAHSNIVDIFENGSLPDGRPFLVMERLEGCSLEQQLDLGRISPDDVIGLLLQLCSALTAAHAAGIVHCDLKPENVFLVGDGEGPRRRIKVLDWGISRIFTPRARPGRSEIALGTPRYISPEQVQGLDPSPASDIYSLGVMAFELFLEEQLFVADSTLETLKMHLHAAPPAPEDLWPGIPPALSDLLLTMLAKKPASRPTAPEVAAALTAIREELRQRTSMASRPEQLSGPTATAAAVAVDATMLAASLADLPGSSRASTAEPLGPRAAEAPEPRRRHPLVRRVRRIFRGSELAAAAVAVILVAGASALMGYRTARGGTGVEAANAATAETLPALPAVAASMASAVATSVSAEAQGLAAADPTADRDLARPSDAIVSDAPSRPALRPLPHAVVRLGAARPAAAAPRAELREARKARAATTPPPRRAPRVVDPNGTIEPY